jgi:hypothetical protein
MDLKLKEEYLSKSEAIIKIMNKVIEDKVIILNVD